MAITSSYAQNSNNLQLPVNKILLKNKFNSSDSSHLIFPALFYDKILAAHQVIPPDFSTCKYGFFCKQELKIEKATGIPVRFRLGSLQQCNYYEGKP